MKAVQRLAAGLALGTGLLADLATAQTNTQSAFDFSRFTIGMEGWLSTGESSWDIRFVDFDPDLGFIPGRSKLEWEDLDSMMLRVHGTYEISSQFTASISYGFGDINDGRNTDTDWYSINRPNDYVFSQSQADTDGSIRYIDINLAMRLDEVLPLERLGGRWELLAGYLFYQEDLRDQNGVQTILFEEPVNQPFGGLNSTFLFEWNAFRLGGRVATDLSDKLSVSASANLLLAVDFSGEGYWNLRSDFRSQDPNFVQSATGGYGTEWRVAAAYEVIPDIFIDAGYWALSLRGTDGIDTTYFADGAAASVPLDSVESERSGFFLGVTGRF